MTVTILTGDCRDVLATLPEASVQACVTSPPYFNLRDYQIAGQIGLEASPDAYVAEMVAVFRDVRRVLRPDGVLMLNLGDSYASGGRASRDADEKLPARGAANRPRDPVGLKPKDLIGIPWTVAFALRADGWWLRQEIIWAKPNPMPESVQDRCTKAHEHVFLLTKSERYFWDAKAIAEPSETFGRQNTSGPSEKVIAARADGLGYAKTDPYSYETRNKRSVWTIASQPFSGAHFATMPPELAETCIKATTRPGDMVLDPFAGAGTTLLSAGRLQRNAIGIELNPEYAALAQHRIYDDCPMFSGVEAAE